MANFRRIKKLLEHLRELPDRRFSMAMWLETKNISSEVTRRRDDGYEEITLGQLLRNGPECETACCLAGDACLLFGQKRRKLVVTRAHGMDALNFLYAMNWEKAAQEALGLSTSVHMFLGEWAGKRQRSENGFPSLTKLKRRHAIKYLEKVLAERNVLVEL